MVFDMQVFELHIGNPLEYVFTGKFEAPSSNWMHEDFPLSEYELFVITKGTLYLSYNQEQFTVPTGSYLLLPPVAAPNNRRKGFQPSDCSFYWMHFSCNHEVLIRDISTDITSEILAKIGKETLLIPQKAIVSNIDKVIVLMKQLQDTIRSGYSSVTLNYMTTVILCEIHNQIYKNINLDMKVKKTQKQVYYDIIDYIKQNNQTALKVSDVAAEFGYNEKYLSHLFCSIAGIPLKQFILTNKMDFANYLLTDTNNSISQIAYSLGFSDSHNFAKAYKKIRGLTPSEYRNAYSKRLLYHK